MESVTWHMFYLLEHCIWSLALHGLLSTPGMEQDKTSKKRWSLGTQKMANLCLPIRQHAMISNPRATSCAKVRGSVLLFMLPPQKRPRRWAGGFRNSLIIVRKVLSLILMHHIPCIEPNCSNAGGNINEQISLPSCHLTSKAKSGIERQSSFCPAHSMGILILGTQSLCWL